MADRLHLLTRQQEELVRLVEVPLSLSSKRPVVQLVKAEALQHQLLHLEESHGFTGQASLRILQEAAELALLALALVAARLLP